MYAVSVLFVLFVLFVVEAEAEGTGREVCAPVCLCGCFVLCFFSAPFCLRALFKLTTLEQDTKRFDLFTKE